MAVKSFCVRGDMSIAGLLSRNLDGIAVTHMNEAQRRIPPLTTPFPPVVLVVNNFLAGVSLMCHIFLILLMVKLMIFHKEIDKKTLVIYE